MDTVAGWIRGLPARHGRRTLVALLAIAALGLIARAYVVVNPVDEPADDSRAYFALAKSLYTEGSFGGPEFKDSSDWSPGAPWLYAAAFAVTGGAREGTARIVEALLGVAAIFVVYLLGRRLALAAGASRRRGPPVDAGGPAAERAGSDGAEPSRAEQAVGLLAAFAVAVYPPFIHSTGELMSEPPAIFTLPMAILSFLWASDDERPAWAWLLPGLLFGATAMFRPEYLLVGVAFVVLAALRPIVRRGWSPGWKPGLGGAALLLLALILPILPWAVRNQVVLDRTVPISTGGGKALYVGTYLPADGEYQRVKAILAKRYLGLDLEPGSKQLEEVNPTPLFDEVANQYKAEQGEPDLPRDSALGQIGKENLSDYLSEDPLGYAAMTVRKVGRMWSSGVGEAMSSTVGRVLQVAIVLAGLAGLILLGSRRRWWELTALATPIVLVTVVGAASLAAPRRNEVLMTLVFPLAALALWSGLAAISSGREWSREQASSPPN